MRTGWERFDFNKDAPLDGDEEELEVAEDEASLRRVTGKSFRFAAAAAKHEEKVESAHDHAMFGAPTGSSLLPETQLVKENEETYIEKNINAALVSDKVLGEIGHANSRTSQEANVAAFQSIIIENLMLKSCGGLDVLCIFPQEDAVWRTI